jgi:hypothetical protein
VLSISKEGVYTLSVLMDSTYTPSLLMDSTYTPSVLMDSTYTPSVIMDSTYTPSVLMNSTMKTLCDIEGEISNWTNWHNFGHKIMSIRYIFQIQLLSAIYEDKKQISNFYLQQSVKMIIVQYLDMDDNSYFHCFPSELYFPENLWLGYGGSVVTKR